MLDGATISTNFAVLRFAKIRTLSALGAVSAHNTRTATSGLAHTTPPPDGQGVVVLDGQPDAVMAWKDRAAAVGLGKPRRDAVLAIEMVMSASPSWFAEATSDEHDAWTARSLDYARQVFGPDNLLQATLHRDEQTPHLHVIAIPLEQKARAKRGRARKGRENAKRPTVLSWGLNADGIIGSPDQLRDHQTAYAACVADLGIRRGRPKRTTSARHQSAAQYRDEAAEDRALAAQERAQANEALAEASLTLANAHVVSRNAIARATKKERRAEHTVRQADERAQAFTRGLDAVEQGELVPGTDGRRFEIRKVETPVLPPYESRAFGSWVSHVRPYVNAILGYARRLAGLAKRQKELDEREAQLAKEAEAIKRAAERAAWHETQKTKAEDARPARDDLNTISELLARKPKQPTEFKDPPDYHSQRERGQGRQRVR